MELWIQVLHQHPKPHPRNTLSQSHLLKQTGLPPVPFLLLFHWEQVLPTLAMGGDLYLCQARSCSCLPGGTELFLLFALKERWFGHRFMPAWNAITTCFQRKNHSNCTEDQHFWSSLGQKSRLGREGSYQGCGILSWDRGIAVGFSVLPSQGAGGGINNSSHRR